MYIILRKRKKNPRANRREETLLSICKDVDTGFAYVIKMFDMTVYIYLDVCFVSTNMNIG